MTDFFSIYSFFIILIDIMGIWLAFWVYFNKPKAKINQLYFLVTISIICYITFSFLSHTTNNIELALFWKKIFFGTVSFFIIFSYLLSVYFPVEGKRQPVIDSIIIIVEIAFFFISLFTDSLIKNIEFNKWGTNVIFGPVKWLFFLALIIYTILVLVQIIKKYSYLAKKLTND